MCPGKHLTDHPAPLPFSSRVRKQEGRWFFKKIGGTAKARMGAHSQTTCGSDSPSHLPGDRWPLETRRSLLAAPLPGRESGGRHTGGAVFCFILLTPQRTLIKIPLDVEKESGGSSEGRKMLLASSLSPLGRESRQAPVIVSESEPLDVEPGSHCSSEVPEKREIPAQTTGNLPRELADSETELEPFTGSALFLEVGSGVRVGVCACARSRMKLEAQASRTRCLQQRDSSRALGRSASHRQRLEQADLRA